jgi:hypothetical protein
LNGEPSTKTDDTLFVGIMSNSHGLSDEQVSNELKRMVAFIKQEAIEKSREIHIKVERLPTTQHGRP